jgi:malonate transporter
MLAIFESILPIFLIIVLGNLLRRTSITSDDGWRGLEQVSYWVLYPTLLFATIIHADFSGLRLDAMLIALLATIAIMAVLVLGSWPLWRRTGAATPGEFSSMFQSALRWNGFIALAVAQKLFPPAASAVVALAMAVIIIPLNVMSVAVVARFGSRDADWGKVMRATVTNPLIVGVAAGIVLRFLPGGLYDPLDEAIGLIASAAIGMGLISVGAGLRPADMFRPRLAIWFPVVLKLAVLPAILCLIGYGLGVRGPELVYLVLCGSVPTAMNGYMLARQLGGDAEFYAAVTTLQTVLAVFTMPAALAIATQLSSG